MTVAAVSEHACTKQSVLASSKRKRYKFVLRALLVSVGLEVSRRNWKAGERQHTRVCAQMSLKAFFSRKHSIAVSTFDAARRRASLHHEIGESVGAWSSTTMALRAARTLYGTGTIWRHAGIAIFRWRARATWTQMDVSRFFAPVPWIKHRVAHRWTSRHCIRQRARLAFRRVQLHRRRLFSSDLHNSKISRFSHFIFSLD